MAPPVVQRIVLHSNRKRAHETMRLQHRNKRSHEMMHHSAAPKDEKSESRKNVIADQEMEVIVEMVDVSGTKGNGGRTKENELVEQDEQNKKILTQEHNGKKHVNSLSISEPICQNTNDFNIPIGFPEVQIVFAGTMVAMKTIGFAKLIFTQTGKVKSFFTTPSSLAGSLTVPFEFGRICILLMLVFQNNLGIKRPAMTSYLRIYGCILTPILALLALIIFVTAAPWSSQCTIYPCYAKNSTSGTCDSCVGAFCPRHWGNTADVSFCKAVPSTEYPSLCGYKYCHPSLMGSSFLGQVELACDGGVSGRQSFLGFPVDEKSGGESRISYDAAQANCMAQQWMMPIFFGLSATIYNLYQILIFSQVTTRMGIKRKKVKMMWWGKLLSSFWTLPTVLLGLSIMLWFLVYGTQYYRYRW